MKFPKYRRHKKIYARVVLNGREIHLGLYDSPESKANYERVVSEWLQTGRKTPRPKRLATVRKQREESGEDRVLTITELAVRYFEHARTYYVKNGQPTSEAVFPTKCRHGILRIAWLTLYSVGHRFSAFSTPPFFQNLVRNGAMAGRHALRKAAPG
ncbi:hypothetical protein GC170_00585 [bacterium]|nr:hypothetical protein [bacterium]